MFLFLSLFLSLFLCVHTLIQYIFLLFSFAVTDDMKRSYHLGLQIIFNHFQLELVRTVYKILNPFAYKLL